MFYSYYSYQPSSYLAHHGILGMKWGVRRYQNKDGTLTSVGKKRYGSDAASYGHKRLKKQMQTADSSVFKKTSRVVRERDKEWHSSNEYKDAAKWKRKLVAATKRYEKQYPNEQIYFGSDVASKVNKVNDAANKKLRDITEKYIDSIADATLQDLGYTSTKSGRDLVKKILNEM